MLATIKALKHAVETLTDASNQAGLTPTRSFVQTDQPTAVTAGDTWHKQAVLKGETNQTSVWDGKQWVTQSSVPTGCVLDFMGVLASAAECPQGYMLCYGQPLLQDDYPGLYAVLRGQFGSTATSFALPDLRGRVIAGLDNMGGTTANRLSTVIVSTTLGAVGGDQLLQAHAHSASSSGVGLVGNNLFNGTSRAMGTADGVNSGYFQDVQVTTTVNSAGGGGSQNVQPTMVAHKMIKT